MSAEGTGARKDDHVRLAGQQHGESRSNGFDDVRFVHHALSGIDAGRVSLEVEVAGARWRQPFYINAMTGGSHATGRINAQLAAAAAETGTAMASGSVSIALDHPELAPSFRVIRDENPRGFVFANVGVERSPDDARRAVDLLEANALQVHVNAAQETVMPEGSRSFSNWEGSLARILETAEVPVVVKEVGFGLSSRTLTRLHELGVGYADVSGRGGTDFVSIENARRTHLDYAYLAGWGQSAVESLLDAPSPSPVLLASGGVRSPLDVVRALALGARAVGVSGTFLQVVTTGGAEAVTQTLRQWQDHCVALLALLGAQAPAALRQTDVLVTGDSAEFARLRGVDLTALAHRFLPPSVRESRP